VGQSAIGEHPFCLDGYDPQDLDNLFDLYNEDWPARSQIVRERVFIDFHADPEQIARQDPMKFDAIKPIGPFYEYRDYEAVPSLQSTLQKAIGDRKQAQVTGNTANGLPPHSQVPEAIDRGMMLDAKMDELKMPSVYPRQELIQVPPLAPPSLKEILRSPSP
jgi:hypothetical protein